MKVGIVEAMRRMNKVNMKDFDGRNSLNCIRVMN